MPGTMASAGVLCAFCLRRLELATDLRAGEPSRDLAQALGLNEVDHHAAVNVMRSGGDQACLME